MATVLRRGVALRWLAAPDRPFAAILWCAHGAAAIPADTMERNHRDSYVGRSPARAILVGGFAAGTLDIVSAMITWSWRVPRAIAGGILGRGVFQSEALTVWSLGLVLHYVIACGAATVYYLASRRLGFLREHVVVCGAFYGIAVWLVMSLVVVPLSALHTMGPFEYWSMVQGLVVHMLLVGLPIAFAVKKLAPA
jgi:hypothetical protein